MPLTDVSVKNAKPLSKSYKLADGLGMYLLINATGGKLWRFDYRYMGKRKTLALGAYPDVSLADARQKRDEARKLLAGDVDPAEHRKAKAAAAIEAATNSLEVIAREWLAKQKPTWADSHYVRILARLENDIFPWLGKKPITAITARELLTTLRRISDRGAKDSAKRCQQEIGAVFRFAIQTDRASYNPVPDLRGALPSAIDGHFAAITDPSKVGELLRSFDAFVGTFPVKCALQLAPLLFVRPGELRQAKWAEFDLDAAEWRFYASKQKTVAKKELHIVPLADQAITILRELQPLTGEGEYLFPGARDRNQPMSEATINAALRRLGWDTKTEITGHGFRAMARTILHERLEVAPEHIEAQLAHKVPDTLGNAYNRTKFLMQRKAMMQQWANCLDELKAAKTEAQVIALSDTKAVA